MNRGLVIVIRCSIQLGVSMVQWYYTFSFLEPELGQAHERSKATGTRSNLPMTKIWPGRLGHIPGRKAYNNI